jgi:hypothetical protein
MGSTFLIDAATVLVRAVQEGIALLMDVECGGGRRRRRRRRPRKPPRRRRPRR